ncbi:MAG: propionate--CoA ligase [Pseudazoarcus pumilus]|nr:propionate--CoA ligase [Pseudazoarcus pumilus]
MSAYKTFHRRSIEDRDDFWREQAELIDWSKSPHTICEYTRPPFVKWFAGGLTNLCHNAVDRHALGRPRDAALIYVSTETGTERTWSYEELLREVERMAAIYLDLGVRKGDRVLIYMPMIPEACFAMLACARIGAIHSVVFGGFAAASLATRIDDATPVLVVSADAGMRNGKAVPYKHLLDEACRLAAHPPAHVLIVDRGIDKGFPQTAGRDVDYAEMRRKHVDATVPVTWLESNEPSYILYTSGTTGKPKGVQRDTGGYCVALAASMKHIFTGGVGETMFVTSDIGWVVGHSYIIYAPLIAGMATLMYEGTPLRPDPGIWWRLVEKYRVNVMFSAPTAVRVLKKQDPSWLKQSDLSSLKHLFLAGEPLDETTHRWIAEELGVPVIDNYWQTETGWPILSAQPGVEKTPLKYGSPSFPVYGYDLRLFREDGSECGADEKGVVGIVPPLPPGCLSTVWGQDERFVSTYFSLFREPLVYSSSDWGIRDQDGYYTILGRMDDVINVAGHRLGTREIEEAVQMHSAVAEVAVVGVADEIKGQMPMAFAVLKDASAAADPAAAERLEREVMRKVDEHLGAIARPARVFFVTGLPKTRSGKMLRRAIQALAEGRDPGDLATIEDPTTLLQIRDLLAGR